MPTIYEFEAFLDDYYVTPSTIYESHFKRYGISKSQI